MKRPLYMDDMYLREWESTVSSVSKGKYIVLERTAFYPNTGGVEWDTGTITRKSDNRKFKVIYSAKIKGEISHEVDEEGLKEADKVHCRLDWARRYKLMRLHTAAHVLSGFFANKLGAQITGGNIFIEKGRMDFSLDTFDQKLIKECIDKANKVIAKDLPVEIYYKPREEALKDPNMVKLANALPPKVEELRIVNIKGFDYQADGGCHVHSLKEVGKILLLKAQNKGKNNRRVYYTIE